MMSIRSLFHRLIPSISIRTGISESVEAGRCTPAEHEACESFRRRHPAYEITQSLDRLRATEFARLDQQGQVYLDYTGGALYAECQLMDHLSLLKRHVFGNPHSKNLSSQAMTELVECTRAHILRYFNASPDDYIAIFTQNATGALKLVGEAYPFAPGGTYMLTADNHNSVNGIREFARTGGASVIYLPVTAPELRADPGAVMEALELAHPGHNNLFAYPAQSNFSGVQHPLEWIEQAHTRGWDVLLDGAAFAPTNRLDLSIWKPDFVALSFYKMFGYPTGIGCLLARRQAVERLRRPWYSGGTVTFSSVMATGHYLTPGSAGFEDGTVNYLSIPAVSHGLKLIESIGIDTIHTRAMCLTGWLIVELMALRHSNGRPVVELYGPASTIRRGAIVQVNLIDPEGRRHDCYSVEQDANTRRIALRAGCHCNPGAREAALGFTRAELAPCFDEQSQLSFEQFTQRTAGKTTGALRASVGLASTFGDVYAYLQFAKTFVDRSA